MTQPASAGASTFPVAELDRRFYAFTLDRLITWTLDATAVVAAYHFLISRGHVWAGAVVIVAAVLAVGLAFSLLLGLRGTSPGKAAVGLRVVHHDLGSPIGPVPALLRSLVLALSALPTFGLGVATLAWTAVMDQGRQRRGWHDHVAESIVVDVRPVPAEAEEEAAAPRQIVNLTAMRLVPAPAPGPVVTPAQAQRPAGPAPSPPVATPPPSSSPAAAPPRHSADGRTVVRGAGDSPRGLARWRVSFDSGESFLVEGLALVGRRPEPRQGEPVRHLVPLRSGDMSLSKTHAQLQVAPDGVLVVLDRGSTNGSILVRQGVSRALTAGRPASLLDGDRVRFGDREMSVTRES
jgi:uncharacterized RDD family membrane protein YckC